MTTIAGVHDRDADRIRVRRMDFELTPDIPERWGPDGNVFLTALIASLSGAFPAGERYFIDSVRHYLDRIDDPELRERVRGFIGQEANHTKEHLAFNRFLEKRGMPVLWIEKDVDGGLRWMREHNTPAENLAHTVALEHLTAYFASAALESPEFLEAMDPTVAALLGWHLIEEIEHRSVAFDVYQRCVGDEALRVRSMAITTVLFTGINIIRTFRVLHATRTLDVVDVVRGVRRLFGRRGVLRKMMPLYLAFYRRDFHPDQHDNQSALDDARRTYLPGHERMPAPA